MKVARRKTFEEVEAVGSLVPPARLAQYLVTSRSQSGRTLEEVAVALSGKLTVSQLGALEAAVLPITDEGLRAVVAAYGVSLSAIAPGRRTLVIDRDEKAIRIGTAHAKFSDEEDGRALLLRYLALVFSMRDADADTVENFVLRDDDMATLAEAFERTPDEVRNFLTLLMTTAADEIRTLQKSLSKRVGIPGLGLFVGRTARGGLVLAD